MFAGAENSAADPSDRYVAYDKVSETDGETFSVYGEIIWDINDTMQLTTGGRYIDEKKDSQAISLRYKHDSDDKEIKKIKKYKMKTLPSLQKCSNCSFYKSIDRI